MLSRLASCGPAVALAVIGLTEWAYSLSESLLSDPLPRRWAHSLGVAKRARSLGPIKGDDAELLEAAAVLRDNGYSPAFTPWTVRGSSATRRMQTRVVRFMAHHGCALLGAEERGLRQELEGEFELERPGLVDALIFCNMTTTPDGTQTTSHGVVTRRPGTTSCCAAWIWSFTRTGKRSTTRASPRRL